MVIADLDEDGRVTGYVAATKAFYLAQHRDDPSKLFLDRVVFYNEAEITHFANNWSKYGVKAGKFQRLDY